MRRALNTWAAVVAGRLALRRGVAVRDAWVARRDECVGRGGGHRAAALWLMGRAAASFADQGLRTA